MKRYICDVCGYIYDEAAGDPDNGVAAGTVWADVPDTWVCPLCGVGKDQFSETDGHTQHRRRCPAKGRCCAAVFCARQKKFEKTCNETAAQTFTGGKRL